jgi:hypothetical protein
MTLPVTYKVALEYSAMKRYLVFYAIARTVTDLAIVLDAQQSALTSRMVLREYPN